MKRSFPSEYRQDFPPKIIATAGGPITNLNRASRTNVLSRASNIRNGAANSTRDECGISQLDRTIVDKNMTQNISTQSKSNTVGNSLAEKTHFFTGTAERVIAWHRLFPNACFFEVIASIISVQEHADSFQTTILLKDKKGPILQVIHYYDHVLVESEFIIGQMLRCVGYMTGINTMVAVSIRRATDEEVASLQRYCYIGDFTISTLVNAE